MKTNLFLKVTGYLVILMTACFLFLRYFENQTLFVPYRQLTDTPKSVHLDYKDVTLKTKDGRVLGAWYIPHDPPNLGTVYFLHGNGGNISHRINKILFFHEMGYNVFIIDYRGYGESSGYPSERGLYLDAQAGYDFLAKLRDPSLPLIVFGESLGGAVAIDLATKKKVDALIVEGTFTSVADMVCRLVPMVPTCALENRFDSISKIARLDTPIFIISSKNDEVVPFDLGEKLYKASKAKKKKFLTLTGGHSVAFFSSQDLLRQEIDAFMSSLKITNRPDDST